VSYIVAIDRLHALGLELAPAPSDGAGMVARRKFDLAHMRTLAAALGNPQQQFRSVLIAGTNGKGSTAATLASILSSASLRVGLYTSPHLSRVNERVRISDGGGGGNSDSLREISDDDFARLYFRVDETAHRLVSVGHLPHLPSFFEVLTALGFLAFAEQGIEIAVLEVGLGGRLDATNIVDPLLSVITDISLDHQEYLGETIAEIAREKAGILRHGGTLVTLPQHPEANHAIGEVAMDLGVHGVNAAEYLPTRVADRGFATAEGEEDPISSAGRMRRNRYKLAVGGETLEVWSPLAGQHQQRNIALAIAAAVELRNKCGYNITDRVIENGIARTQWLGRLELLPHHVGSDLNQDVLLDVAHNPAGAWTLRAAIADLPEPLPRTLLFSCLRDKDLKAMAQILFPLFDRTGGRPADHIVFAPIANPRAADLEELLAAAKALQVPAHPAATVREALAVARALTPAGGLIVATGSVYLVGEVRDLVLGT
jgi:dihydrofolate synthase/folylpolyglutamate synthase